MILPDKPTVAIVQCRDGTQNPELCFQVTIDATLVSPSEAYIRFGTTAGDELIGWKQVTAIEIIEVLGWPTADGTVEKAPKPDAASVNDIDSQGSYGSAS